MLTLQADLALYRSNATAFSDEAPVAAVKNEQEVAALVALLERSRTETGMSSRSTQKLLLATGIIETRIWRTHDAELHFRQLLEVVRDLPPSQQVVPPDIVMGCLAPALHANYKDDEAELMARLAAARELDPANMLYFMDYPPSMTLGAIAAVHSRLDEAGQLYRRCLEFQTNVLGEDHVATVRTMQVLAMLLVQQGDWEDARRLFDRQRRCFERKMPEGVWIAYLHAYEATLLAQQGRMTEASEQFAKAISLFHDHPSGNDLSWITRTRAIVQMGLGTGQPWKSEGLRQCLRGLMFKALYRDTSPSLTLDGHDWSHAEFSAHCWSGEARLNEHGPAMHVTGVEALRSYPELAPGLYLIKARLPHTGRSTLETQGWVLFADWNMQLQGALRDGETTDWESSVRIGPIEERFVPSLVLEDWFEDGFGPARQHLRYEVKAGATIDLPRGHYRLITESDDGIRVWIDGTKEIDHWEPGNSRQEADIEFNGIAREVRLEYFQHGMDARLWVYFEPLELASNETPFVGLMRLIAMIVAHVCRVPAHF